MDRLTYAGGTICFILLLDVANADGDYHRKWRKKSVDYTLTAIMISSFVAVLIVVSCVIFWCTWWCRRHRGLAMLQSTPLCATIVESSSRSNSVRCAYLRSARSTPFHTWCIHISDYTQYTTEGLSRR
ncbi:hypothetical protein MTO96_002318 [Rhipicephalus appendiculatus]